MCRLWCLLFLRQELGVGRLGFRKGEGGVVVGRVGTVGFVRDISTFRELEDIPWHTKEEPP